MTETAKPFIIRQIEAIEVWLELARVCVALLLLRIFRPKVFTEVMRDQ